MTVTNKALDLIHAIDTTFPGSQTVIVGGAVRDFLLDRPCNDVDLATNIPLTALGCNYTLQDITKSTVNAQPVAIISWGDEKFEIAQFRTDSIGTNRKENIATPAETFAEDAARRDITINALAINAKGDILDPTGFGLNDLKNGIIRCVGNPRERFAEDASRILRVLRFAATFDFKIDFKTWEGIVCEQHRLTHREEISPESIAKEIFKAAKSGPSLARFVSLLDRSRILRRIIPELAVLGDLFHDTKHHPEANGNVLGHILECLKVARTDDPVTLLGILFHDIGKGITAERKFPDTDNLACRFHGHEEAGVPIASGIFSRLRFNDLSEKDKEAILFSVGNHGKVHSLGSLRTSTVIKLVHSPHWEVLKEVSFADEQSRGIGYGSPDDFDEKIRVAEQLVGNISVTSDELRDRIKLHYDGHRLMEWFPELRENRLLLGKVIAYLHDYMIFRFQWMHPTDIVSEDSIRDIAQETILNHDS